MQRNVTKNRLL